MDTQELIIGYVLGLLDPEETYEAERLIARDGRIRAEVERLQDDIHLLAYAVRTEQPPAYVKQKLMNRITTTKNRTILPSRTKPMRKTSWAWSLALAIVIALGGWNVSLRNENGTLRSNNELLTAKLDVLEDTKTILAGQMDTANEAIEFLVANTTTSRQLAGTSSSPSAAGTMYMQPGNRVAVLVVEGLQPLPEGTIYQFWLARQGEEPIPSNTFQVDANGHAQLVIQASDQVNDFQQVMVTIESVSGTGSTPSTTVLEGSL